MKPGSNKLVDKYQYNDSQIRTDGMAQLITAKHIVLKQSFTLKKISVNNPNAAAKYFGIVNEMNVLKTLGDQPFLFKCHKMLKTSNNLYLVYDLMGNHSTLAQVIDNQSLHGQTAKINVALKILRHLKQLKSHNILYLDVNVKIIEVIQHERIKFLNLQNAIFLNKNISSLSFLNLQISNDLAPELKEFIESCSVPYEKDIDFTLFNEKINKADLFAFGKILFKLFEQEFSFIENQGLNDVNQIQHFQVQLEKFARKLTSQYPNERPTYEDVQALLTEKYKNQEKKDSKPKIKISRLQKSYHLRVSSAHKDLKASRVTMKHSKITLKQSSQLLSLPTGDDSSDNKSIRSSGDFTDSTSYPKNRRRKNSCSYKVESEASNNDEAYKTFVLKVLKRRNLCNFLMNLSGMIMDLTLIEQNQRVMLSFLLLKKSVLLMCSLARFISTGQGDCEELVVKDWTRKEFSKTNDFFILSVIIDKEMDAARTLYQNTIEQLSTQYSQLKQRKEFNFVYECKSENLDELFMKQLIRKCIHQILKKIQTSKKQQQPPKKVQRNYLNPLDNNILLRTSQRRKNSDFDDVSSVISSRTIRTSRSRTSRLGEQNTPQIMQQSYQSENILRNLSFDNLIYVYMMGLILDFETYEKMFSNLIGEENPQFEEQSLLKKLRKMEAKDIALKLQEVVN